MLKIPLIVQPYCEFIYNGVHVWQYNVFAHAFEILLPSGHLTDMENDRHFHLIWVTALCYDPLSGTHFN